MKLIISTFIVLITFIPYLQAYPEVEKLAEEIKPIINGTDWKLTSDWRSITLTYRNCKFLNPISLPVEINDQTFEEYGFVTDYRITITFNNKLTDEEYQQLVNMRNRFIVERTKDMQKGTKAHWSRLQAASKLIKLPQYKTDRFSIVIYSSQDNFFEVRPKIAHEKAVKILELLKKQFVSYSLKIPNKKGSLKAPKSGK